jgi:glycosyltransferase involved in cell wall biosynthesis
MSAPRPLVSILINNYNYGRFLRDAIESALNQTYANTEVIVVDDGSTDDSRQIIASYGSRIIPVLKENGGQASAFNAGFALCRGEWVCLLDSDDTWHPTKIEKVVGATRKFPEAVLVYHKYQAVSEELKPVDRIRPAGVFSGWIDEIVQKSGGFWMCSPTSALALRKDLLDRIGSIPEKQFKICADAYLIYLVPFLGPVFGLNQCLVNYRLHGRNGFCSAALLRKSENAGLLHEHLRRYEELVESVNSSLRRLGVPRVLDLKNHWNYQELKFKLNKANSLSFLQLAWRALVFPGDPALVNRLRWVARFSLDSLRYD